MRELRMADVVDRFRANVSGAGIVLSESEMAEIVDKGYLKQVLAFEGAASDPSADAIPAYLDAWGERERTEPSAAADAPGAGAHPVAEAPKPLIRAPVDLLDTTILAIAPLIRSGEVSPVELVEASLSRIAERDPAVSAFQTIMEKEARAEAASAEREIRAGAYRGPLHGVPLAVKDLLDVAGLPTTAGSRIMADRAAGTDATAVRRLREAGAVIVGKTKMSEFAYSPGSNNDHFGPTGNPRGLERDAGGSSSGSAAAVADRMVFAALGTDTGGSVRIPASACGIVGLKPTFGRLSLGGAVSLSWSLDHLGPLARDVADAALILGLLTGRDPRDARTRAVAGPGSATWSRRSGGLRGLRVGALRSDGSGRPLAEEAALAAWRKALGALADAGAEIVDVDLPEMGELRALNAAILAIEASAFHLPLLRDRLADYGEFVRLRILAGFAYSPVDFARAQLALSAVRRRVEAALAGLALLSLPTLPGEAPALGVPSRISLTAPFNVLGWPVAGIPVGHGPAGMPLGMQLAGRPWDEATVLVAARAVESRIAFDASPAGAPPTAAEDR